MASKMKSLFVCQNCGYENPKWYGKCPQCGEWDTMQEEVRVEQGQSPDGRRTRYQRDRGRNVSTSLIC